MQERRASAGGRSQASQRRPTGATGFSSTPPPTSGNRSRKRRELQPGADAPLRSTPIRAVVLTNGDVDHVAGLLSLRERQPFAIYATAQVLAVLEENSIFNVLDPAIVPRRMLPPQGELEICDADGRKTGVKIESFAVSGKVALYLEDPSRPAGRLRVRRGRYDRRAHRRRQRWRGGLLHSRLCAGRRGSALAPRWCCLPAVRRYGLHRRRDDRRRRWRKDRRAHGTSRDVRRGRLHRSAWPA